jgi:hypothetical protein
MRLDYSFIMKWFWSFPAIVLLFVPQAAAGDLTLFAGFQSPSRGTLSSGGQTISDPTDYGVLGVRYNGSGAFIGFEHTLAYSPNFVQREAWSALANSNLIVGVPAFPIRPYGTVGAGLIYAGGRGPGSFGLRFALNYGGGVKISSVGPVGFRIDFRGYRVPAVESRNLHIFEASAGLLLSF